MKKGWKKGYKIVSDMDLHISRPDDDSLRYHSAFMNGRVVWYPIGKETVRPKKCGPLAVFDTLDDAFESGYLDYAGDIRQVFVCEYLPSNRKCLYTESLSMVTGFPEGTVFADKVILRKEIK